MKQVLLACLLIGTSVHLNAQVINDRRGKASDDGLRSHFAPRETMSLLSTLIYASEFDRAKSAFKVAHQRYPWDPSLLYIGIDLSFLSHEYGSLSTYLKLPEDFHRAYPDWGKVLEPTSWRTNAVCYVAELNGFRTGRNPELLEAEVLTKAWEQRASLPFGMIDEDGVHVDKQVLALLLLRDSFSSHRKLLFDRAAKLAPNDTFILELQAKWLVSEGEEAQAVAMYKKALKAKASDARIKHLKKALAEAEKLVEWRKIVGPRTDKKSGGG